MPSIVNIAVYRFVSLSGLPELRAALRDLCHAQNLQGTVLLSPEGINVFVAGTREGIDTFLSYLRSLPPFADLEVKESFSNERPFNRMLVKIKKEIIAFGVPGIAPAKYTSRRVSAGQLKQWLDEGRPVTLLDTRNNFEVRAGTFKNALPVDVDDFRQFPDAVNKLPADLKRQPIVTFCTGGVRCEKAAPYLEQHGFEDVYQLDGGILKYLEECGGAHYDGHCFVFDKRVAVDANLKESDLRQCYVCQAILSAEEQASPSYVEGQSCPHCYRTPDESRQQLIERRNASLRRVTSPLPGSVPHDDKRPMTVPKHLDGVELLSFLSAMDDRQSLSDWRRACEQKRIIHRGNVLQAGHLVRAGDRIIHKIPMQLEPDVGADIEVLFEDDALIIVSKPSLLPIHPAGPYQRNTLSYLMEQVYQPLRLRPLNELHADDSGIVVFARTREVVRQMKPLIESGQITLKYVAQNGDVLKTRDLHRPRATHLASQTGRQAVQLHLAEISFPHPTSGKRERVVAPQRNV